MITRVNPIAIRFQATVYLSFVLGELLMILKMFGTCPTILATSLGPSIPTTRSKPRSRKGSGATSSNTKGEWH